MNCLVENSPTFPTLIQFVEETGGRIEVFGKIQLPLKILNGEELS